MITAFTSQFLKEVRRMIRQHLVRSWDFTGGSIKNKLLLIKGKKIPPEPKCLPVKLKIQYYFLYLCESISVDTEIFSD